MPISTVWILKYVEQCYALVVLNYILVRCPWEKQENNQSKYENKPNKN